jgi:GNAT superfamily N-acetyltransferase
MSGIDVGPETLFRLTGHAMVAYMSFASHFETRARPGFWCVLSGEPVADLNYLLVTEHGPGVVASFERQVSELDRRDLPFACMVGPDAVDGMAPVCRTVGLVHAVDWPLMVCAAAGVEPHADPAVDVRPVESEGDAVDFATILADSFHLPKESIRRAMPLATAGLPGVDIHVARVSGRPVSTVTATRHDRIVGIWAMGTVRAHQGRGVGRVLLSQVMDEHRRRGADAFFLGATPSGKPLYDKLGYRTIAEAQVWVRGETHQA